MSKILVTRERTTATSKSEASRSKGKDVGGIIIPPKGGEIQTFEQVDELVESLKTELSGIQKNDTFVILRQIDDIITNGKSNELSEDEIYQAVDKFAKEKSIYVENQVPKRKKFDLLTIIEKHPRKYAKFITRFKFPQEPIDGGTKGDTVGEVKKPIVIINNPSKRSR